MVSEIIIENAEEIAQVFKEAVDIFDKKQMSVSLDIKFRQYYDKISKLSDHLCYLERYLSDSNFESGRYKLSLRFKYGEDKEEVYQYLDIE